VNRLFRLSAVLALVASFVLPIGALAVDPSPSPSPSTSPTPDSTQVVDSELPVPDADLLESIPVTVTGGRIGSSLSPAALIFTDVDTRGGVVRITNPTDRLIVVTVRVRDYTVDANGVVAVDENGEPTTGVPNYQYASGDWYTFAYTDFLLPAGRQINLPFTIAVPAAAAPGDHTAALVVVTRAAQMGTKPGENGVIISSQLRFLLRLQHRVAGAQSAVPSVKVNALIDGSRRIDFIATVDNEGTTVLDYKPYQETDPIPFFRIKAKGSGELIRTFDIVKGFYVLPEGNRIISVSWRDEDLTEPTGSAAEIARLKADEKTASDREQLGLIRAKIELAEARAAYSAAAAKLEPAVADVVAALRGELYRWYEAQNSTIDAPVPGAVLEAQVAELVTTTAQSAKLPVSTLSPLATLAAAEVAATVALRIYADTAALPYSGEYVVEFVLPKKGGLEEIISSTEFSFVNADPAKTLADSAPFTLILIALVAGGAGLLIALTVLRRRRSDDVSAE
jgi:hypothetical protein